MDISQYGSMFIQLPERYFSAGQQVDGTVLLNLLKPVPAAKCLNLVFAGTETVRLIQKKLIKRATTTKGKWKNHYGYENFDQKRQLCLYQFPLYHFPEERIEAGMYTFPFTFMLPKDIPSTFEHKAQVHPFEQAFGKVEYSLLATIQSIDPNQPSIKYLQAFTVNKPAELYADFTIKKYEVSAENIGCFGKSGTCKVTCYFEKNEYCPGETANLFIQIDNSRCKDAVQSVAAAINRSISMHVGEKISRSSEQLEHRIACERIAPGETKFLQVAVVLGTQIDKGAGYPSCSGTLIQNQYYGVVQVTLEKPLCKEGDRKDAKIPFLVRNPDPKIVKPQLPPDWEPKIYPLSQFQLLAEYNLPILPPEMEITLPILQEEPPEENNLQPIPLAL